MGRGSDARRRNFDVGAATGSVLRASQLYTSFRTARSGDPESRDSGSGPSDHPGVTDVVAEFQAVSACSRSAIRSSLSSMPIDRRTTSGAAPDFTLAASSSWLWVVDAG